MGNSKQYQVNGDWRTGDDCPSCGKDMVHFEALAAGMSLDPVTGEPDFDIFGELVCFYCGERSEEVLRMNSEQVPNDWKMKIAIQIDREQAKRRRARESAKARADAYRSLGMVRGKDSMGRTIWE